MKLHFSILLPLIVTSCGHLYTKSHSYAKSSTVTINGAKVGSAVKPEGGKGGFSMSAMVYMAGAATLDGPFRWRIEAEGKEGIHKSLTVHRVKVITSKTKRSEWYPRQHLGTAQAFSSYKKEPGKSFANFQIPGKLKVYPRSDGDITVIADISVTSTQKTERRQVRFLLRADTTKEVDFINLPAEIIKGSRNDPREWQWGAWPEDRQWAHDPWYDFYS
ncbi:hypothetical protein JIN77_08765 [Verrucomicrobiaceae bacterium R5-34]|nr:hypothetical protein [Verrucomicrobiaceae bacterium R5-34]